LAAAVQPEDLPLRRPVRVADVDAHQEAVELVLREGVGALVLVGVLCGQDQERRPQGGRPGVDRHLAGAHGLQEGALGARGGARWVRGVARLISSASTTWAKRGPGLNTNSPLGWWKTLVPSRSLGSRSEVNWMRWNAQARLRASALASSVLPTPGTSSMSRW